jgi:hypothetical protein
LSNEWCREKAGDRAVLRHEDRIVDIGEYIAPWQWRLPTRQRDIEHPHTLDEYAAWPDLDRIGYEHLSYLQALAEALRGKWLNTWQQILVVGPFLGLKRRYKSVPIVVVAAYEDPEVDIERLSNKLADAYIEYGILPDIHMLPEFAVQRLEQAQNLQWERTKQVSVSLPRQ